MFINPERYITPGTERVSDGERCVCPSGRFVTKDYRANSPIRAQFIRPIADNNFPWSELQARRRKIRAGFAVAIFNPCNQQVDSLRSYTTNAGINSAGKFNYRSPRWQVLENQLSETIYRILGVPCGFPERDRTSDCLSPTPIAGF